MLSSPLFTYLYKDNVEYTETFVNEHAYIYIERDVNGIFHDPLHPTSVLCLNDIGDYSRIVGCRWANGIVVIYEPKDGSELRHLVKVNSKTRDIYNYPLQDDQVDKGKKDELQDS